MQDLQENHVCDWKFLLKNYCNKNNRKVVFPPVFITFMQAHYARHKSFLRFSESEFTTGSCTLTRKFTAFVTNSYVIYNTLFPSNLQVCLSTAISQTNKAYSLLYTHHVNNGDWRSLLYHAKIPTIFKLWIMRTAE